MSTPRRPLLGLTTLLIFASLGASVLATDAPRPWEPDAFLPVTEARIAALPAAEQPAWRAYWQQSIDHAASLPPRDLIDHTPNKPVPVGTFNGGSYSKGVKLHAPAAWHATEEARTVADHVAQWQRPSGGWVKSGDYTRESTPADDHHDAWSNGTFDNDATLYEMRFLALVAQAGGDGARVTAWRASFLRGLDYLFAAQYPNGGFPQIYPLVGGYHDAITYNDDAMVHILELCRDITEQKPEFAFVSPALKARAGACLNRGIQCVLATQLRDASGQLTIWGQQHDPLTLQPCAARNFEPISLCSNESVGLVKFLMTIPAPTPEIIAAVEGAVRWFPAHALHGFVWDRRRAEPGLQPQAGAADLWSRYYELGTDKPIFSERDRMVHYDVSEISLERRRGYGWFNTLANDLPATYAAWKAKLPAAVVIWQLEQPDLIGGHATKILGQPKSVRGEGLAFNGSTDAVFLDTNPIEGLAEFTIEINIRPDADGPAEQRFFHIEDKNKSRLLFETRVLPGGRWALDTFLYANDNHKQALLDRTKTHPCGAWTWVSLTYKDGKMTHAINGVPELAGEVAFAPMTAGTTSIGVRQNLVYWFRGNIREVRIHRTALTPAVLQHE